MPEALLRLLEHAPFIVGATGPKMNTARMIETLLIAAITAGITVWGVVQVLDWRVGALEKQVTEFQKDMTAAKVSMGDRWTASDELAWQQKHLHDHSRAATLHAQIHSDIETRIEVHKVAGHKEATP